jgi:mRNA interferase MazF
VVADRRDAPPKEPNKLRPAIAVADRRLFDDSYLNTILVALPEDATLAVDGLSPAIGPTIENGCARRRFALCYCVTTTSKKRLKPTASRVTAAQLSEIRHRIGWRSG